MRMVFETAKVYGANGIILWGSSFDLTTKYDLDYVIFVFIFMINFQHFLFPKPETNVWRWKRIWIQ